uniref:Uncharacterized protein n=1 Tax=Anopheles quadriannulatus TaxID=34691 RepID=A0A182XU14_ANOQN
MSRVLKKPASVLHSRIVTVSRLTVTSVINTWLVVCAFGSQRRGGAARGDSVSVLTCLLILLLLLLLL